MLHELQRFDEALASCDRALALRPDLAELHAIRGNALCGLKRYEEALVSYDRVLALRPAIAEVAITAATCCTSCGGSKRRWRATTAR